MDPGKRIEHLDHNRYRSSVGGGQAAEEKGQRSSLQARLATPFQNWRPEPGHVATVRTVVNNSTSHAALDNRGSEWFVIS